jgi:UDP-glucose 4-epimerase
MMRGESAADAGRHALVLGGAGFIGSHVVERFVQRGWRVTVIDPDGSGPLSSVVGACGHALDWIRADVAAVNGLGDHLQAVDVVVDAMGWTRHLAAIADPVRDLDANVRSHLSVLAVASELSAPFLYLGSRGQYGTVGADVITEDTPQLPVDVQGTHKAAADHLYRVYARLRGLRVRSLRFGNTFGERQPLAGEDVGLVGLMLRAALAGETIDVYGTARARDFVYAGDVAHVVEALAGAMASMPPGTFEATHVVGGFTTILEFAHEVVRVVGSGQVRVVPIVDHVKAIDTGDAPLSAERLRGLLPDFRPTPLGTALERTVASLLTSPTST